MVTLRPGAHPNEVYLLDRSQTVRAPRTEVFAWFADVRNLIAMSPRWPKVALKRAPDVMATGARIDLQLRLFGVPLTWETLITEYAPNERFVDVQLGGPFRNWRHTHSFTDAPDGDTVVSDHVEYDLPLGPLGRFAHLLMVRRQLASMFDHRARVLGSHFG